MNEEDFYEVGFEGEVFKVPKPYARELVKQGKTIFADEVLKIIDKWNEVETCLNNGDKVTTTKVFPSDLQELKQRIQKL